MEWENLRDVLTIENREEGDDNDSEIQGLYTLICSIVEHQGNMETLQNILARNNNRDLILSACDNDAKWMLSLIHI